MCATAAAGVAFGLASPALPGASKQASQLRNAASPSIGAQVYVFTQLHRQRVERLRDSIPAMLQTHADAGIRNLELVANLATADRRTQLLESARSLGIQFPIVYSGAGLYDRGTQDTAIAEAVSVARDAAAVGAQFLNCNPTPKPAKARKSDDELAVEAEGIRKLGAAVRAEGLTLLLHQHDAEMLEDARNWRYWLANTSPAEVGICLDTHWAYRAGEDPVPLLRECRSRLECVHLRNSRGGSWWESFDDGDLDYRPVAEFLAQTGFTGHLMVELAWEASTRHTRGLTENLRLSRNYVERRFPGSRS